MSDVRQIAGLLRKVAQDEQEKAPRLVLGIVSANDGKGHITIDIPGSGAVQSNIPSLLDPSSISLHSSVVVQMGPTPIVLGIAPYILEP